MEHEQQKVIKHPSQFINRCRLQQLRSLSTQPEVSIEYGVLIVVAAVVLAGDLNAGPDNLEGGGGGFTPNCCEFEVTEGLGALRNVVSKLANFFETCPSLLREKVPTEAEGCGGLACLFDFLPNNRFCD